MIMEITDLPEILQHNKEIHAVGVGTLQENKDSVANSKVGEDGASSIPEDNDEECGQLAEAASSVCMKILYATRMARFDLLRPVQGLAKWFTKWNLTTYNRTFSPIPTLPARRGPQNTHQAFTCA
jgi:hypothetical protein